MNTICHQILHGAPPQTQLRSLRRSPLGLPLAFAQLAIAALGPFVLAVIPFGRSIKYIVGLGICFLACSRWLHERQEDFCKARTKFKIVGTWTSEAADKIAETYNVFNVFLKP